VLPFAFKKVTTTPNYLDPTTFFQDNKFNTESKALFEKVTKQRNSINEEPSAGIDAQSDSINTNREVKRNDDEKQLGPLSTMSEPKRRLPWQTKTSSSPSSTKTSSITPKTLNSLNKSPIKPVNSSKSGNNTAISETISTSDHEEKTPPSSQDEVLLNPLSPVKSSISRVTKRILEDSDTEEEKNLPSLKNHRQDTWTEPLDINANKSEKTSPENTNKKIGHRRLVQGKSRHLDRQNVSVSIEDILVSNEYVKSIKFHLLLFF